MDRTASRSLIVIIEYGIGNVESVLNAFKTLGANCVVSSEPTLIAQAKGIVLPGVGAFSAAMHNLRERNLDKILNEAVLEYKKPFLGICLGLQLIALDSVEVEYTKGLGWIEGHVLRLKPENSLSVPQVGWNEVNYSQHSILFQRMEKEPHFYFDHCYYLQCSEDVITATCDYGGRWAASIQKNNIFATQFHPEKSQRNGLKFLKNFLNFTENSKC